MHSTLPESKFGIHVQQRNRKSSSFPDLEAIKLLNENLSGRVNQFPMRCWSGRLWGLPSNTVLQQYRQLLLLVCFFFFLFCLFFQLKQEDKTALIGIPHWLQAMEKLS